MIEPTQPSANSSRPGSLFTPPAPERSSFARAGLFGAVAVVFVILGSLLLASRSHHDVPAGAILSIDPQSAKLAVTDVTMSESTSLSGGKSTFIDGHIRNTGSRTVDGIVVQVLFRNDMGLAPQAEVLPLQLIRAREPYIDTQPVSAAPLAPGEERDFRLPFENITNNWNIQIPEIRMIRVTTK